MEIINLYILDMSLADNTSGVDRYIETLLKGLEAYPFIHVHWIHLRHDKSILFYKEEQAAFYTKITIPLPQQYKEIIIEKFWIQKYNEQIFRLVKHLFENKQNCILHLHTLNLIDLALLIKGYISCKIITHLHCIPWKAYYDTNKRNFNKLYKQVYLDNLDWIDSESFITNNCEIQSYNEVDHVICVTKCAVDFLRRVMHKTENNISVIPNGINNLADISAIRKENKDNRFKLLYVGVLSESKGLNYILKAIRKVKQQGYNISLAIAGKTTPTLSDRLYDENKDLSLRILGRIPFEELKQQYITCDAGIIASLQEQSSYVAIEMAMFGLPIISTAVDGLDEIFADEINALKVNTHFSNIAGLSIDIDAMAEKIIKLIENKELRIKLGQNARFLYEQELNLERMMKQTVSVYQNVIGGSIYEQ